MKKTAKLLLLILLSISNSYSQSLPDSSATWTIAYISMGSYYNNQTFQINNDTLINDVLYKSIFSTKDSVYNPTQAEYHSCVRESDGKWFFIPSWEEKEYLLYDFTKILGDTISINNPWTGGPSDLIVFSIDSLELADGYYKTIDVGIYDSPSGNPHIIDTWIEGIGSINGLFYSGFFYFDIGYQLLCFHYENNLIYLNSPDGSCGYIMVGLNSNNWIEEIRVKPNPVTDQLIIESQLELIVEIYNISGRKLISTRVHEIDVSYLINGLYILKIHDSNKRLLKSVKLMKL